MKPATRKTSAENLMPTYLLTALISSVVVGFASAGDYHQQASGCIDGNCGAPTSPFGHYQGSWRRWPFAKDSTMTSTTRQGTTPREPFIPEPIDEGRYRPRTRSDRPMDPKDMAGAGVGSFSPAVPGAGGEGNPFNNTVDDSDMFNAGGSQPADNGPPAFSAPDVGGAPPTTDVDPIFDAPADGGTDFGLPGGNATDDEPVPDFFDNSNSLPAPPSQQNVRQLGAIRSIKSRGVQLQTGIATLNQQALPAEVTGVEISLPVEDSVGGRFVKQGDIGLVSFDDFENKSRPEIRRDPIPLSQPSPAKLSQEQVVDSVELPSDGDPSHNVKPANDEAEFDTNPLRRGAPLVRRKPNVVKASAAKSVVPKNEVETANLPNDLANNDAMEVSMVADSRALNNAVASRSPALRKNPLRR